MTDRYTKDTRACIVRENIARGLGVEDIAVMFKMPVADVRDEVVELRKSGFVAYLFSHAGIDRRKK